MTSTVLKLFMAWATGGMFPMIRVPLISSIHSLHGLKRTVVKHKLQLMTS
jgi:hypothetical protein